MTINMTFAQSENFKKLSAEWQQWALSVPPLQNPILDETGEDCFIGQRGPIWFLTGNTGGTTSRTCSVPEDKALFFPVVNFVNINTPNVCGQGADNIPAADLRAFIAPFIDGATNLTVEVDGEPVKQLRRIESKIFEVALPEDNIFDAPCVGAGLGNVPAGVYSPAVDDGFYVMLNPLTIGPHILHIHGEIPDIGFFLDVTYNLNIVPVLLE